MLILKRSLLGVMVLASASCIYARDYSKWMADLPNDSFVCTLSIPGSHDTMTHKATYFSQTQSLNLAEQLECGARAIDLRIGVDKKQLHCYHGTEKLDYSFEDAFNTMKTFLDENPSEFIVIHLLNGNSNNGNDIKDLMNDFIKENSKYFAEFKPDLKVSDMRGKIVFLRRWDLADWNNPSAAVIYNWNDNDNEKYQFPNGTILADGGWECKFACQDVAHTNGNHMQNKKDAIKQLLDFSTSQKGVSRYNLLWTVNMLSAYTTDLWSSNTGYAENAEQTSAVLLDYINSENYKPGPLGIVLADWIGTESFDKYNTQGKTLVEAIVENNFKEPDTSITPATFARHKDFFNQYNCIGAKAGVPYVADFNGDGNMDILMSGEAYIGDWADASYVALANAEGSPYAWNIKNSHNGDQVPVYYGGHGSRFFDFNQNGNLDMLLLDFLGSGWTGSHPNNGDSNRMRLAVNDGEANFTEPATPWSEYKFNNSDNKPNGQAFLHCVAVGDVNNDGYPDLLVQNEMNSPSWERFVKLYINDKGNGFIESDSHFVGSSNGSVFLADLNGNGYLDIIVSGYGNDDSQYGVNSGNTFHFYKNDGKGNFTLANADINEDLNYTSRLWGHERTENVVHLIDFDQDGKIDILLLGGLNDNAGIDRQPNNKYSLLLRNVSNGDGKFAFEPENVDIWATSDNIQRLSALADFNGDGFVDYIGYGWGAPTGDGGHDWVPNNHAYGSFSTGENGRFETTYNLFDLSGDQGFFSFGDIDGDGMLDFISPDNGNNDNPFIYHNRTLGSLQKAQVAEAPSTLSYDYDKDTKQLTVSWEPTYTPSGSKSIYNVYIKKDGQTFMRVPAREEDGKQKTYLPFNTYLANEKVVFENVEPSKVEVGVQSVAYNYNASQFAALPLDLAKEDINTGVAEIENPNDAPVEYYTIQGIRVENPSNGIYIVRQGNKVTKRIFE